MWPRRIVWALCVLVSAALFVLADNVGTLCVLVACAVVPAAGVAAAALQAWGAGVEMRVPLQAQVGEGVMCELSLRGGAPVPVCTLDAELAVRNAFAGDEAVHVLRVAALRGGACVRAEIEAVCCGMLHVQVKNAWLNDPFCLTRWRVALPGAAQVLVVPQEFPVAVALGADEDAVFESDEYSMARAGNDPSETYALREYQPGDPVKSVHWKLSTKADKLIVRELGLPVANDVMVFFENTLAGGAAVRPRALAGMAAAFASASRALAQEGVAHELVWFGEDGALVRRDAKGDADVDAALAELLRAPIARRDRTVASALEAAAERVPVHVVGVSAYVQPGLEQLAFGRRMTALVFAEHVERVAGVRVVETSARTCREDLGQLEI